ncbi:AMP-binding protein [Amycolatopsis silviterrae]|uniref:AMP-binding protein n=1 Tax=Amycolatopsis silviterrae TaxID=1656914 RepID=A0ABW5H3J2_9PSEU
MNVVPEVAELAEAGGWQDRIAYLDGDRGYTHGEVHHLAGQAAAALAASGVRQGDRVLLALPDGVGLVASFLGTARLGAVAVVVNPALPERDLARFVADSAPTVIVADRDLGGSPLRQTAADLMRGVPGGAVPSAVPVGADAPLYVQYTSGTTGRPKGAVHTHGHLAAYHRCIGGPVLDIGPDDVILSVSKMYFAYGFGNALVFPLFTGARAVLFTERPSAAEVAARVRDSRVTLLFAVPSFYAKLVSACAPEDFATVRAAVSAGEPLPAFLNERLSRLLPAPVLEQIGSTEAGHAFCANTVRANAPGTLGWPVPEFDLRLLDSAGEAVPEGDVGELWVRGPSIMTGYLSEHGDDGRVLSGGWLNTRDRARRNPDGTYTHCGRADDIELVGGINVAATEVEEVISRHPAVREAAVASVLRADGSSALQAFVVAETADGTLAEELLALARSELAAFKVPRSVRFVDELPRTDTGKLRRFVLRRGVETS